MPSVIDAQQRFNANRMRMRVDQRPHTRRHTVSEHTGNSLITPDIPNQTYDERIGICLENMNRLTGEAREVWSNLYDMLTAMGADGVSSDEESVVDNKRVYHVKVLPYRSGQVTSRVKFIDLTTPIIQTDMEIMRLVLRLALEFDQRGPTNLPGRLQSDGQGICTRVDGWKSNRTFIMST